MYKIILLYLQWGRRNPWYDIVFSNGVVILPNFQCCVHLFIYTYNLECGVCSAVFRVMTILGVGGLRVWVLVVVDFYSFLGSSKNSIGGAQVGWIWFCLNLLQIYELHRRAMASDFVV